MKKRSQGKMLNNKNPRMDSFGTPITISSQELYNIFIFVLHRLFVK